MSETAWTGQSVVVPAIGGPSSVSVLRSLGRSGVHTIAVSEQPDPPGFRSRYCDEAVRVPSPADDLLGYRDALLELARGGDVRTILPLREADVYVLATWREAFAEHVAPLWPDAETLRVAHDRVLLDEAARAAGVPAPETLPLDAVETWDRERFVKARYAILADAYLDDLPPGESRVESATRHLLPGEEPDVDAIAAEMGHVPIAQRYLPGGEYALWALYDEGEPVATCQKRQLRAYKYAGGTSVTRETVFVPEIERLGRALLDHLDWHGLASVQFIGDERTGEFSLLEINPRAWLSLPCAVQAGADFPAYFWRVAGGEWDSVDPGYETGVRTHLLRGNLVYLHSVLRDDFPLAERPAFHRALRDVGTSIAANPNFDYLSRDDPAPFVRDALNTVGGLL